MPEPGNCSAMPAALTTASREAVLPPVAIGGVGGSGTRIGAALLRVPDAPRHPPARPPAVHPPNPALVAGRVRDVGPTAEILRAHPHAEVIDAPAATILPGLTDAHAHLYGLGLALDEVDLVGTTSFDEVLSRLKPRVTSATANEWIQGRGWDQTRWPSKEFPTAAALDAVISDHPVWLKRVDGHAGVANSVAMRLAGITAATPDPPGGRMIRDAQGNPTGVFVDHAQSLIESRIPGATFEQVKRRVLAAAQSIATNGLTEIHDAGAEADTMRAVRELVDEKKFPIRLYQMVSDAPDLLSEWFKRGPMIDYGGRWTVRSVKMYSDGALGSRGAALLAPYSDDPNNSGLLVSTVEHMTDVARRGRAAGFQMNTHAIGDRSVLVAGADEKSVRSTSAHQQTSSAFVEETLIATPRLSATGAIRYDRWLGVAPRSSASWSPRFSLLYHATDRIALTASAYRAFRAPTLNELVRPFRVGNVLTLANENLGPERLSAIEAGIRSGPVRVTLFSMRTNDVIANVTRPFSRRPHVIAVESRPVVLAPSQVHHCEEPAG